MFEIIEKKNIEIILFIFFASFRRFVVRLSLNFRIKFDVRSNFFFRKLLIIFKLLINSFHFVSNFFLFFFIKIFFDFSLLVIIDKFRNLKHCFRFLL